MIQQKTGSETFYRSIRVKNGVAWNCALFSAIVLATSMVLVSPASVLAQDIGNASAGREYAALYCATCHAIDGNEVKSPNPKAAPFAEIARTPGMNGRALTVWLSSVHKDMPDFIIEKADMENVVAYIGSLAPNR
ncbi:MAG: cytochrome c [Hyphomicrobiaceae bacterium]